MLTAAAVRLAAAEVQHAAAQRQGAADGAQRARTGQGQGAAADRRQAGVAIAVGQDQRAAAELRQPAAVAGGDGAGEGHVLPVGIDGNRRCAIGDSGRIIHGIGRRILQRAAGEGDRAAAGQGGRVGQTQCAAGDRRPAAVGVGIGQRQHPALEGQGPRSADRAAVGLLACQVIDQRPVVRNAAGGGNRAVVAGRAVAQLQRGPRGRSK